MAASLSSPQPATPRKQELNRARLISLVNNLMMNHRQLDHAWLPLVVSSLSLAQPAAATLPGECPLHDPVKEQPDRIHRPTSRYPLDDPLNDPVGPYRIEPG
jgi:hypothetical protein